MCRLTLFLLALAGLGWGKQSYSGYQVIRALAPKIDDLLFLQEMEDPPKMSIWDFGPGEEEWGASVTFHVHPDYAEVVKMALAQRGYDYRVQVDNLQGEIDIETEENVKVQSRLDDTWFESYHTYEEMMLWIDILAVQCQTCSTFNIGTSFQGRPLKVIKMEGAPNGCAQKPTIWIDAGIHCREWISHTTSMYLMDKLVNDYTTDPFVKKIRDDYDWYILSTVNPDGYAYTWSDDRMWRKSRRPNPGSTCIGTDINRNFDFMWMTTGASNNPCSETFAGQAPYSDPESKAVADYMLTLNGTWEFFLTLHTYGQLYMSPWGYTASLPEDYNEMIRVGQASVNAIRGVHGITYTLGSAANVLYESSGTSRDWAKGVPKIPYVFTIELRNTNSFVLPPTQILPTGQEIWAGLKAAIAAVQENRPPNCIS